MCVCVCLALLMSRLMMMMMMMMMQAAAAAAAGHARGTQQCCRQHCVKIISLRAGSVIWSFRQRVDVSNASVSTLTPISNTR